MRIFITGIGGFVGKHLSKHLIEAIPGAEIYGAFLKGLPPPENSVSTDYPIDLKDEQAVTDLIEDVRPDHIYHLAAQASPKISFEKPWETLENNIQSQLNVFLACLKLNIKPRILVISSADIYGTVRPELMPIHEDIPFQPSNPYAVSKVTQDMLARQYFLSHQLPTLRVRPFNHTGPGQSRGFVAVDFAMQIARIEAGQQEPVMEVGNLASERDFSDVRDVVRAYLLLMEKGTAGEVYNVASGKTHSIQKLLDVLLGYSTANIEVKRNAPAHLRPSDIPVIRGSARRLYDVTGWEPYIQFETTLLDVLNDCRERVQHGAA